MKVPRGGRIASTRGYITHLRLNVESASFGQQMPSSPSCSYYAAPLVEVYQSTAVIYSQASILSCRHPFRSYLNGHPVHITAAYTPTSSPLGRDNQMTYDLGSETIYTRLKK